MTRAPGELIAYGRTSVVRAYGNDSVVKMLRTGVPENWADFEAELTSSVRALDIPAPEVRDVLVIDGHRSIVSERIFGPSMWEMMSADPDSIEDLVAALADVQRLILRSGPPAGVPDLVQRLCGKIRQTDQLDSSERAVASDMVESLPRGAALLHGDLHPGNVLMGSDGPRVIDWFDAAIGHPVADMVRSSILIRPSHHVTATEPATSEDAQHLPGASQQSLERLHRAYSAEFADDLAAAGANVVRWEAVIAAGRLNEGAQADTSGLLALWNARDGQSSALVPATD